MTSLTAPPAAVAKAAVQECLRSAPWLNALARYGWKTRILDELSLVVNLSAPDENVASGEPYTLRLTCDFYPAHPPDVRFVNPQTLQYDVNQDSRHLPHLTAPYCYVHAHFRGDKDWENYPYGPQLVCSSVTLGYYASNHSPQESERWRPGRDTILSSVYVVHQALNSEHYKGRMG